MHLVKTLGNQVYFHGGEISNYNSEESRDGSTDSASSTSLEPERREYALNLVSTDAWAVNETLSLPLDESWDISAADFNHIKNGEIIPINEFALWADHTDQKLYRWGGGLSWDKPIDEDDLALWVFTPEDNDGGTWGKQDISNQEVYDDIASTKTGGAISCGRKGYYIGGYGGPSTDPKFGNVKKDDWVSVPGILTYDMSRRTWSNDSTAAMSPPYGGIVAGMAACTDVFESSLIVSVGGRTSDVDDAFVGKALVPVDNITFWDTSQDRWLWQKADGDIPQRSEHSCAVGAASKNGTYEM